MATTARDRVRKVGAALHPLVAPGAIFVVALIAYSHTLTRWYTFDAISYAYRVRACIEGWATSWPVHPHHLIFDTLGVASCKVFAAFGVEMDALRAIQYMNAFFGALGLALLYAILRNGGIRFRQMTGRPYAANRYVALAATLVLGCGFGYWVCATDGRVNMPGLVAVILTIGLAWGMLDSPSSLQCAATAVASVLAVSLHQSHGLLAIAGIGAMLISPITWRHKIRYAALYIGVFITGVAAAYLVMAFLVKGIHSFSEMRNWTLAYAQDGRWWSFDIKANITQDIKALVHAFVTSRPTASEGTVAPTILRMIRLLGVAVIATVPLVAAHALYTVAVSVRQRLSGNDIELAWGKFAVLALVAVPYSAFFTVWNPGYFVFWMPTALVLTMWLAMMAAKWRPSMKAVWAGLLLLWASTMLITNLSSTILRRMDRADNPALLICDALNRNAEQGDLVVTTGTGSLALVESYIPYFTRLSLRSMNSALKASGGDVEKAVAKLRTEMEENVQNGHKVIILSDFNSDPAWRELGKRYGASTETAELILAGYRMEPLFSAASRKAYCLVPTGSDLSANASSDTLPGIRRSFYPHRLPRRLYIGRHG